MSQTIECPRCSVSVDAAADNGGRRLGRCPVCGTQLVVAVRPKEADVRDYLYGHRLAPIAPASGVKARPR
ncbi:MAG TPA: hypothetical protein VHM66_14350 [Solirubrobacterales bacterium]|nr:hypothetical protein [Solirubrobacterales bacterium]